MRKIGIFFAAVLFFGLAWSQELTMSLADTSVDINESVRVLIDITGSQGVGSVSLDGIDDFDVINSATSDSIQIINGERSQKTTMQIDLKPKENGTFILGPAHLTVAGQGKVASSNQETVEISGEKLFVGAVPQGWQSSQQDTELSSSGLQEQLQQERTGGKKKLWRTLLRIVLGSIVLIVISRFLKRLPGRKKQNSEKDRHDEFVPQKVDHTYNSTLFIPDETMKKISQELLDDHAATIQTVIDEVGKIVVGQKDLIRNLMIALIAQGHILLEGVPGLAKTLSVETLSKVIGVAFGRVQFTPDLLPSDLTGTKVFDQKNTEFVTKKGPIFTNLLLADEINRAPAKVQSALLEAMAEKQVTIGDERLGLEDPFVVMATQNPLEQEGTYSLPEAQLDRFLLKTVIGYPTEEEEIMIMKQETGLEKTALKKVLNKKEITSLQAAAASIRVADGIYTYVNTLVRATREPSEYNCEDIAAYISVGVSPRASLALIKAAKVLALMAGRSYVLPEDIKEIAYDVMRHRIITSFQAISDGLSSDDIITTILDRIPVVA